ncbi:VUT family protein [Comamonas sp. JUb58]|uniref:VUT family protein n=1 Tax=Comamonas sp. JUb58 TaxID=2485114 RepID=UPI00105BCF29|nr:VUT family protein [Comamonas sp. JUb58]
MTAFAIFIYAGALLLANLSAATFGPWVTPLNAFVLIGLDLALRDLLHTRLRWWQMLLVIAGTAAASWLISHDAGRIAIAGAAAFFLAGAVDWMVFAKSQGSWAKRAHKSNLAGAAVDSLVFPVIAFGSLLPLIVLGQFAAKTLGSVLWVHLLRNLHKT